TLEMAWELHDRYGAWPSMQFATPILGTALHEQCASLGLVPPEGLDLKDGALFRHRPCFDPPGCPPGYVAKARAAFDMKLAAREARKLIMNITYKCANRCVFCATGDRVSAALAWDKIEAILRQHREQGTDQLDIDGGEPTLHPRLVDAIRLARELGYRSVNVTTNGRLLRDRALAERLLDGDLQKMGRTMIFAADPRFPEQVNLYQWLGARREKRAVCAECPWTTVCEGFQVFAQEKPDMRVERVRPVVATA